jgi:hypothetical protein
MLCKSIPFISIEFVAAFTMVEVYGDQERKDIGLWSNIPFVAFLRWGDEVVR